MGTEIKTIPAREIKRRGISAVDGPLKEGPVYVIRNDEPAYVILDPARYEELREAEHEAFVAGVRESLADYRERRVRTSTAQEVIDELGLED